jgi:AcrR family transcriptional regulator
MPVKSKFTTEDIVDAAFLIARSQGADKCSARAIAHELNSSTMPIYSCLNSMKELEEAVLKKALDLLISYETKIRTGDVLLDMGIGYIMFAKTEKYLFRMLFLSGSREGSEDTRKRFNNYVVDALLQRLSGFDPLNDFSQEQKKNLLNRMWVFTHGLAVLLNNSIIRDLSEQQIAEMIMDTGIFVILGERMRREIYTSPEVKIFLERAGFPHLGERKAVDFDLF